MPFINDTGENVEGLLDYCIRAKVYGIMEFGIGVTLRDGDRQYFYAQLDRQFPGMKERYQRAYGNQYELPSKEQEELLQMIRDTCTQNGIVNGAENLFSYMHTFEDKAAGEQISFLNQITGQDRF